MNSTPQNHCEQPKLDRRALLIGSGVAVTGLAGAAWISNAWQPRAKVFVARHQKYDGRLADTIRDGLLATDIEPNVFRGRRVVLKPNMVEPSRKISHMTTHPAVVVAAVEVFKNWGAAVSVGEAPGHVRDTEMALVESGVVDAVKDARTPFADLNYEPVVWRPNRGGRSNLDGFWFPRSIAEADFIISMPKMKTHHWMGLTATMKNLYGVLPGLVYGWPKNVLHHAGIPQTVYDINASLPQLIGIVDGIDCMEGDGPILGSRKTMGLIIVGRNLPAIDATVARIIGLAPERVPYLALADGQLGPISESRIEQTGERWRDVATPFTILDQPHLKRMLADESGPLVS